MGGGRGGGSGLGVRVDVIEELKFLGKFTKKNWWGGGVFVRFQKEIFFLGGGGLGGGGEGWGGQGGCERRIKVFVKIQKKKNWGGGRGGVRLVGWGGWVRVDVNVMLGVGSDVEYGGCEPRVEGIVQGTKRYCTILRK